MKFLKNITAERPVICQHLVTVVVSSEIRWMVYRNGPPWRKCVNEYWLCLIFIINKPHCTPQPGPWEFFAFPWLMSRLSHWKLPFVTPPLFGLSRKGFLTVISIPQMNNVSVRFINLRVRMRWFIIKRLCNYWRLIVILSVDIKKLNDYVRSSLMVK